MADRIHISANLYVDADDFPEVVVAWQKGFDVDELATKFLRENLADFERFVLEQLIEEEE